MFLVLWVSDSVNQTKTGLILIVMTSSAAKSKGLGSVKALGFAAKLEKSKSSLTKLNKSKTNSRLTSRSNSLESFSRHSESVIDSNEQNESEYDAFQRQEKSKNNKAKIKRGKKGL